MKKILGDKVIYKFVHGMEEAYKVSPGEIIKVETNDCFFQQLDSDEQVITEIDFDRVNPATGPIYVEGAEPGDLLQVKIIDINIKDKGVAAVVPGGGALGDQATNAIVRMIDIKDNHAIFKGVKIPLNPMIGVIGVAPAKDDGAWETATPWRHGGNMDTKDIKAGSILYFPVNQSGAMLALGDCHAAMADGEVSISGLEIPGEVTLEINIIKGKSIEWPLLETQEHTMIIASGDDLDSAAYEATSQAVKYLKESLDIEWEEAYILASLTVDLKISQIVNSKKTVRSAIPKDIVSTEKLIQSL